MGRAFESHDTGLYYLQSRYYNPEWGRFLNADIFVVTGQGFVGNNMFAYCGNNPVNCADSSGTISFTCIGDNHLFTPMVLADRGGGGGGGYGFVLYGATAFSARKKSDDMATWLEDVYNTINNVYQQQVATQTQITMMQNEIIADALGAVWDAYQRGYEIQQQAQLQNSQAIIEGMDYFTKHPKIAEGLLRDMAGASSAITTAVSCALAGGPVGQIVGAIVLAGFAIWDVSWTVGEIIGDFQ